VKNGFDKNKVPAFDQTPASKLGIVPLVFRFLIPGRRSVAVGTQRLGYEGHHGRVAMLVNERSAGAAEMVAASASENPLATLVGARTAGRVVAASAFEVGDRYRVVLPVAAFLTWQGRNVEGTAVSPHIATTVDPSALMQGHDSQLERAVETARGVRRRELDCSLDRYLDQPRPRPAGECSTFGLRR
jgi:carboxyl-terminal processing protease